MQPRKTLFVLTVVILASRALPAAVISNGLLRVDISDDNGVLTVTDLRTKQTWHQARVEESQDTDNGL